MIKDIFDMYHGKKPTGFFKHYLFLFSMVEGLEAKNTFEFGAGGSTRVIMEAHKYTGGSHYSNDIRDIDKTGLDYDFANKYLENWTYIQKNSQMISSTDLKALGPFDFVLHDGSHIPGEVLKDLRKILTFMKQNSILLIHDTENNIYGTSLKEATHRALANTAHEIVTLPYGYGLTIIRILENFGHGTVTPLWTKP